jgi:hypothetical protein
MRWRLHLRSARLIAGNALKLLGAVVAGVRTPAIDLAQGDDPWAPFEELRKKVDAQIANAVLGKPPQDLPPTLDPEIAQQVARGAPVAVSAKGREMLEEGNSPVRRPQPPDTPVVVRKRQVQG